jgi:hypothetical protein
MRESQIRVENTLSIFNFLWISHRNLTFKYFGNVSSKYSFTDFPVFDMCAVCQRATHATHTTHKYLMSSVSRIWVA